MYQTIIIAGNVGKDPVMKYTPTGQPVTTFSVAVNRQYTKGDQKVKETSWFRVETWGKLAEVCNTYVHKGDKVLVEGRLICDPATGGPRAYAKKDGTPAAGFEVNASTVTFLGSKSDNTQSDAQAEGDPF